nr:MAG TPA: hypothetical protein [Caudoviricetes sp.]
MCYLTYWLGKTRSGRILRSQRRRLRGCWPNWQ